MKVPVYNTQGKQTDQVEIPDAMFAVVMNPEVVKQVIVAAAANARQPWAHAKDRSEQQGGGRKPWRQKGTGRARHGSRRSPIWVGGGVTFGPRNDRNYLKKVNKKVRRKALHMMLSAKADSEHMIVVDGLKLEAIKTKDLAAVLTVLPSAAKPTLILTSGRDEHIVKSAQNLQKISVEQAQNVNAALLAQYEYVVITKEGLETLISTFAK